MKTTFTKAVYAFIFACIIFQGGLWAQASIQLLPDASPNNIVTASPGDQLDLEWKINTNYTGPGTNTRYEFDADIEVIATPTNGGPAVTIFSETDPSNLYYKHHSNCFDPWAPNDINDFAGCTFGGGLVGLDRMHIGAELPFPSGGGNYGGVFVPCLPILPSPHYYEIRIKVKRIDESPTLNANTYFWGTDVNGSPFNFSVSHNSNANALSSVIMKLYVTYTPVSVTGSITHQTSCYPDNGAVNITPSGGGSTYTYNWSGPGGFTATTQDITGLDAGTYNVTVTDQWGCTSTGSYVVNNNISGPFALSINQPAQTCVGKTRRINVNNPDPNCTYTWYYPAIGGSVVGTGPTLCVEPTAAGSFTYRVDANCGGCLGSGTVTLTVLSPAQRACDNVPLETACSDPNNKIHQPSPITDIEVYPNPFGHQVQIQLPDQWQVPLKAEVYNLNGQQVYRKSLDAQSAHTLDLQTLPTGNYLLRLTNPDGKSYSHLISKD